MTQISNEPTITDFLLARIAEDERAAREEDDDYADTTLLPTYDSEHQATWNTDRVLAECAAKRMMIDFAEQAGMTGRTLESDGYGWGDTESGILKTLAAVYSDHPDYRQEWALNG